MIFNTIKNYYAKRRFALDICNGQLVLSSNKNNKESSSSKKFKRKRKKNIFSVDFDPLVKWNDSLKIQFDSNHYIQCLIHTGWGLFFSFFFFKSLDLIQLKEYYWQLPKSSMENCKHANKYGGNVRDFCYFLANQCGTTGENR